MAKLKKLSKVAKAAFRVLKALNKAKVIRIKELDDAERIAQIVSDAIKGK